MIIIYGAIANFAIYTIILHKACGTGLERLEEMRRSTVRQKDASETEGESIQNSDQASNAIRGGGVGYGGEMGGTDWGGRDGVLRWMCGVARGGGVGSEHVRGAAGVAQASGEIAGRGVDLVRACDEERWRTHTEESDEGRYNSGKNQSKLRQ